MSESEKLNQMTVLELRRYAREQGVTLSNLTTKAAIVERIQKVLAERGSQPTEEKEAPVRKSRIPVRQATIVADDADEIAASTPRAAFTPPNVDKNRTSTGKLKPAFTLQGSRAWHNPQPYVQTQPQASRYAPQITQGINTIPRDNDPTGGGLYPPPRIKPAIPRTVSRFGPAASTPSEQTENAYQQAQEQRTFSRGLVSAERNSAFQSNAFRSALPQVPQPPYQEEAPEPSLPIPEPSLAEPDVLHENKLATQVVDLLASGELGDGAGILEIQPDGYGFLRTGNLLPGRNDIYISNTQIRRFRLRNGDYVAGKTRKQRETDRYAAMVYITNINDEEAENVLKIYGSLTESQRRPEFDEFTPVYPSRQIKLSNREENDLVLRMIDLFVPIGFGQRAMIVAAPKVGKTTILKKIALSLKRNHPDVHTMMLLVDERPEEVTDLKETVGGDIFYSTFDEPPENHAKVSELTLERAMRLVEQGKDVVILLDSLTRMSRAYNLLMPSTARVMTGGLAAGAMNKPKRFFGAARNMKEGGSLTIIATALVDTGSRMDGVIFEEFKGTGNMELTLDRNLSERRLFPAVSLLKSGTRHEELLLTEKELDVTTKIRGHFSVSSDQEAIALVLSMLEKSRDNDEFVERYDDWMKLMRGNV